MTYNVLLPMAKMYEEGKVFCIFIRAIWLGGSWGDFICFSLCAVLSKL